MDFLLASPVIEATFLSLQIVAAVAGVASTVRMAAMVNMQAAGRKAGRQAGIR